MNCDQYFPPLSNAAHAALEKKHIQPLSRYNIFWSLLFVMFVV